MIFHILIGQRKVNYPGECAPEALEVMDDNAMSDNAEWMETQMQQYRASGEFDNLIIVKFGVQDSRINELLFPKNEVKATIL